MKSIYCGLYSFPKELRTLYYWRKLSVFLPQILTNIPKILAKEHLFLNAYTVLPFYFKRFTVNFSLRVLPVCNFLYCYCSSDMICDRYSADPGGCRIAGSFCCLITRSCPFLLWPQDCSLTGSSIHGISQAKILEWVAISFSKCWTLPNPGIEPMSPAWQANSLLLSYQGSPHTPFRRSDSTWGRHAFGGDVSHTPQLWFTISLLHFEGNRVEWLF